MADTEATPRAEALPEGAVGGLGKRFLHDVIVHPLIFFTNDAAWVLRWHDRLAEKLDHMK